MSEAKKMSLRDTIVPKSDQLNYDDVMSGPVDVKITGLAAGSQEQPVIIRIVNAETGEPMRDYKPCKGMRRVMIAVWGDSGKDWIGKRMRLVGNAEVKFGGVKVGGIQVSHVSGIDKPHTVMLTTSRAKRSEYTVGVLVE